jgi:hypothetical protein
MDKTNQIFDILLLIARPAAGKSEIIAHLKNTPLVKRVDQYHIGRFDELDDFPMLWTWFEEDAILQELGHPRLHTDEEENFLYTYLWDVLIKRINLEYSKIIRDQPEYHSSQTTIIEFARGSSHGGFTRAFQHLSHQIAENLAILYIDVSWEESLRKNQARFNPNKPDSVLEHGLSNEKMKALYKDTDWMEITKDQPEYIKIQGVSVPYVVFDNEDDVTTAGGEELSGRLSKFLGELYNRYQQR